MRDNIWTVEVNGPKGKKIVALDGKQVEYFAGRGGNAYADAAWLAYCDLWTRDEEPAEIQQADGRGADGDEASPYALPAAKTEPAQGRHARPHRRAS